jgi:hypothetical protein
MGVHDGPKREHAERLAPWVMFRFKLIRAWWKALDRRSQRPMWWHQFQRLLSRFPVPHPRELMLPELAPAKT